MIEFDLAPRAKDRSWLESGWPATSYTGRLADLATVTRDELTFWFFLVDVTWKVNGIDLSIRTLTLPVVDFILMLDQAGKELATTGESRVETTHTQHVIYFTAAGDRVRIRTSYTPDTAEVDRSEFDDFLVQAPNRGVELIFSHHPELRGNAFLRSLRRTDP